MKVLAVGSGGREHALCWKLAASPLLDKLYCAPGNAGIAEVAETVPIAPLDFGELVAFCQNVNIDFVVVGPEAPLCAGLVDRFDEAGIAAFGPSAKAARLEGSKGFAKDFCARHGIPTAPYRLCRSAAAAKAFVEGGKLPIVLKADGLAAGKGVAIAETVAEAHAFIDRIFSGAFGAPAPVVIEDCLRGEEASFFALCDGKTALYFGTAQDHKRLLDFDAGPNTGGMGCYSPAAIVTPALESDIMARIVKPTLEGMAAEGAPFTGFLYCGLMLTEGGPMLLEYNVRLGDPEAQVLLPRLKSDLLPALVAARDGVLDHFDLRWHEQAALAVVLAARGYPEAPLKGGPISNLDALNDLPDVALFHAGTARDAQGRLIANGGRVLNVTALGSSVSEAHARAYRAVALIDWKDAHFRRDIGFRAMAREQAKGESKARKT